MKMSSDCKILQSGSLMGQKTHVTSSCWKSEVSIRHIVWFVWYIFRVKGKRTCHVDLLNIEGIQHLLKPDPRPTRGFSETDVCHDKIWQNSYVWTIFPWNTDENRMNIYEHLWFFFPLQFKALQALRQKLTKTCNSRQQLTSGCQSTPNLVSS